MIGWWPSALAAIVIALSAIDSTAGVPLAGLGRLKRQIDVSTLPPGGLEPPTPSVTEQPFETSALPSGPVQNVTEVSTLGGVSETASVSGETVVPTGPVQNVTESSTPGNVSVSGETTPLLVETTGAPTNESATTLSSLLNATESAATTFSVLNVTESAATTAAGNETVVPTLPILSTTGGQAETTESGAPINDSASTSSVLPVTESFVITTFSVPTQEPNEISSLAPIESSNETSVSSLSTTELVTGVSIEANATSTVGELNATETRAAEESSTPSSAATAANASLETTAPIELSNTTILVSESTVSGFESNTTLASETTTIGFGVSTPEGNVSVAVSESASITTSAAESSAPSNVSEAVSGSATSSSAVSQPPFVEIISGRQVSRAVFDCSNREPGLYGNPREACDSKFYICTDPSVLAYEQPCSGHLYFDDELKVCESWIHIPACSGRSRPTREPTRPPRNESLSTVAPIVQCANRSDGNYPDPIGTIRPGCSNRYYVCVGGFAQEARCPFKLIFDNETNRCEREDAVFACSGTRRNETSTTITTPAPTFPPVDFDCKGRKNGYYVVNCSNIFYSCNSGQAQELHCPRGLVFDMDSQACEVPSDTFICTGSTKRATTRLSTTTEALNISTTPSPLDCFGKPDGIYPDPLAKCSRDFYFCAHNTSFRMPCPANLYYDVQGKKCDLWLNVFECSGLRPTPALNTTPSSPPTFPPVKFNCSRREDGNYVNPENRCSKFYYQCSNMDAFMQDCPAELFYDPDRDMCDSWVRVFACSGRTLPPSTAAPNFTEPTTEVPAIDCTKRLDGIYPNPVNACSNIFYECSGGVEYEMQCPETLFYDVEANECEQFENVFACSKVRRTTPAPTPSTARPTPAEMPIDCTFLANGDYEDPKKNCSNTYYSCSGGYAFKRECPANLFFDAERDECDRFFNVFSCSGRTIFPSTSGPSTRRTPRPVYPFDCTRRYDGIYPAGDCVQQYWACVGGLTFPEECKFGLVYDEEFNDCEFPYLVPKCGGHRITPTPKPVSTTKSPVVLDCTFLEDGNYPDPRAPNNCSSVFYSCSSGVTWPLRCPTETIFDPLSNSCIRREFVAACGGEQINSTAAASNTMITRSVTGSVATATPERVSEATTVASETTTIGNETTVNTESVAPSNESTTLGTTSASEEPRTGSIANTESAAPSNESTTLGTTSASEEPQTGTTSNETTIASNTESLAPGNESTTLGTTSGSEEPQTGTIGNETTATVITESVQPGNESTLETTPENNEPQTDSIGTGIFTTSLAGNETTGEATTVSIELSTSNVTGETTINVESVSPSVNETSTASGLVTTTLSSNASESESPALETTSIIPANESTVASSTSEAVTSELNSTTISPVNETTASEPVTGLETTSAPVNETSSISEISSIGTESVNATEGSLATGTTLAPSNETTESASATSPILNETTSIPANEESPTPRGQNETTTIRLESLAPSNESSSVGTTLQALNETTSIPVSLAPSNETTIRLESLAPSNESSSSVGTTQGLNETTQIPLETSAPTNETTSSSAVTNEIASSPVGTQGSANETTIVPTFVQSSTSSPPNVTELTSVSIEPGTNATSPPPS